MEKKDLAKRKKIHLKDWDYKINGAYFITICAKDKQHIFGKIKKAGADGISITPKSHVGCDAHNAPYIELSGYGKGGVCSD